MTEFNPERILMVIFEEVRRMPGKDLKVKLDIIRRELDKRFRHVVDILTEVEEVSGQRGLLKRGRENDTKIK